MLLGQILQAIKQYDLPNKVMGVYTGPFRNGRIGKCKYKAADNEMKW